MDENEALCIGLLWSEMPLQKESAVLDRLRREGLYDTWERALDWPLAGGGGDLEGDALVEQMAEEGWFEGVGQGDDGSGGDDEVLRGGL